MELGSPGAQRGVWGVRVLPSPVSPPVWGVNPAWGCLAECGTTPAGRELEQSLARTMGAPHPLW